MNALLAHLMQAAWIATLWQYPHLYNNCHPVFTASEARRETPMGRVGGTLVQMVVADSCRDAGAVLLQTRY